MPPSLGVENTLGYIICQYLMSTYYDTGYDPWSSPHISLSDKLAK